MKVYVVLSEWCVDYEDGYEILGVFSSKVKAINRLKSEVNSSLKPVVEDYGYEIEENGETCFQAGREGYYAQDHVCVNIIEVENAEIFD